MYKLKCHAIRISTDGIVEINPEGNLCALLGSKEIICRVNFMGYFECFTLNDESKQLNQIGTEFLRHFDSDYLQKRNIDDFDVHGDFVIRSCKMYSELFPLSPDVLRVVEKLVQRSRTKNQKTTHN